MKRMLKKRSTVVAIALLCLTAVAAVPAVVSFVGGVTGVVNVEDFGAKPNGADDSTQAFSDAAYYLKRKFGGGKVMIPAGTYKIQGVPLLEGVHFCGVGMRGEVGGKGPTTLELPASPVANVSMFRVPCEVSTPQGYTDYDCTLANSTDIVTTVGNHGWTAGQPVQLYGKNGPNPTGNSEIVVLYAGEAVNGAGLSGNTLRLYGTRAQAVTGGSTGVTNFTTDGFVFTAATTDVCTSNHHRFKSGDAVRVSSTTTLPAGLSASTTYYIGRPGGTTFYLYTSSANAITGGATGLVDITDTGTGTHSVSLYPSGALLGIRSIADLASGQFNGGGIYDCELNGRANGGALTAPTALQSTQAVGIDFAGASLLGDWHIERCFIRNFDIGVRDGMLGNVGLCIANCEARYNFCAFNIGEQPVLTGCTISNNYYAVAGRLVDGLFQDLYLGDNYVGISGYLGYTGRWAGATSAASNASVTNCNFSSCVFFGSNIVGLSLSSNSTVTGCLFVGYNTQTADGGSAGMRLAGDGNKVVNCIFGEGNAGTSFNLCGIMLDAAAGSNVVDTLISNNTFYLASCPAIMGGNSQLAVYGTGAYGSIGQVSVLNNVFRMLSHRAIDLRTTTGTAQYWHISGNRITNLPSGSAGAIAALATTDALIEGAFRYYTLSNNYFHKNGGLSTARGFTSSWGSAQSGQIINNRFEGWTSTNQNVNIAAGGGDALTQLALNWYTGGGASIGATDNTIKADNIGP